MNLKECACCDEKTLPEDSISRICPVCGWEDDPIQNDDPDYAGGANHISLNEAKQAFAEGRPLKPLMQAAFQRWKQRRLAAVALEEAELEDEAEYPVSIREPAIV
jgi:hypothetical protein